MFRDKTLIYNSQHACRNRIQKPGAPVEGCYCERTVANKRDEIEECGCDDREHLDARNFHELQLGCSMSVA